MSTPTPVPPEGSSPPSEAQARRIAGYEILGKIGQGAMGMVFKARQLSLDRVVALKVLPPRLTQDKSFIDRFVREARSTARLSHPHIVRIYDVDCSKGGIWYFSMEYLPGGSVRELLKKEGRLTVERSLRIATQIAQALAHANEKGIVHRDVKPDNMMLDTVLEAKLADLGLARVQGPGSGPSVTQAGAVTGTPYYMAPEQAEGGAVDTRADLYALGASLFQMLTGVPPYRAESPLGVITQHLTAPIPDPRAIVPGIPGWVASIVMRLLAKKPEDRYADPAALLEALRCLPGPGEEEGVPAGPSGRGRRIAAAALVLVLLAGAALAVGAKVRGAARERAATAKWDEARDLFAQGAGRLAEARSIWEAIVREFPGTRCAREADSALRSHPLPASPPEGNTEASPPDPVGVDREAQADLALAGAGRLAERTVEEIDAAIRAFDAVAAGYPGTSAARVASNHAGDLRRRRLDLVNRQAADARRETEWRALEEAVRLLCGRGEFREANQRLIRYRDMHRGDAWEERSSALQQGFLRSSCERAFEASLAESTRLEGEGRLDEALAAVDRYREGLGEVSDRASERAVRLRARIDEARVDAIRRAWAEMLSLSVHEEVAMALLVARKPEAAADVLDAFAPAGDEARAARGAARGWLAVGATCWDALEGYLRAHAREPLRVLRSVHSGRALPRRIEGGSLVVYVQSGGIGAERSVPIPQIDPLEWIALVRAAYGEARSPWREEAEIFAHVMQGDWEAVEGMIAGMIDGGWRGDDAAARLRVQRVRSLAGEILAPEAGTARAEALLAFAHGAAEAGHAAWALPALDRLRETYLAGPGGDAFPPQIGRETESLLVRCRQMSQ
ncbi:MAG: serine/threonine protein kinase [Planctomycetes bacterium]|nr:serine/threonine protein kinase [Planctomycetota bacterium]